MKTLLEFITYTKGVEYLLAIAFLFAFIAFWQLVHHRGKGLVARIIPLVVLALACGALASTCAPPAVTMLPADVHPSESLIEYPGSAAFPHDAHTGVVDSCATCHHHSGDKTPSCERCHGVPFDPENLSMPGLKAAYHGLCQSCHEEVFSGPGSCAECHTGGASVEWEAPASTSAEASKIAHGVVGKEDCLMCHEATMPTNHAGRNNDTCQLCHKPKED